MMCVFFPIYRYFIFKYHDYRQYHDYRTPLLSFIIVIIVQYNVYDSNPQSQDAANLICYQWAGKCDVCSWFFYYNWKQNLNESHADDNNVQKCAGLIVVVHYCMCSRLAVREAHGPATTPLIYVYVKSFCQDLGQQATFTTT